MGQRRSNRPCDRDVVHAAAPPARCGLRHSDSDGSRPTTSGTTATSTNAGRKHSPSGTTSQTDACRTRCCGADRRRARSRVAVRRRSSAAAAPVCAVRTAVRATGASHGSASQAGHASPGRHAGAQRRRRRHGTARAAPLRGDRGRVERSRQAWRRRRGSRRPDRSTTGTSSGVATWRRRASAPARPRRLATSSRRPARRHRPDATQRRASRGDQRPPAAAASAHRRRGALRSGPPAADR